MFVPTFGGFCLVASDGPQNLKCAAGNVARLGTLAAGVKLAISRISANPGTDFTIFLLVGLYNYHNMAC